MGRPATLPSAWVTRRRGSSASALRLKKPCSGGKATTSSSSSSATGRACSISAPSIPLPARTDSATAGQRSTGRRGSAGGAGTAATGGAGGGATGPGGGPGAGVGDAEHGEDVLERDLRPAVLRARVRGELLERAERVAERARRRAGDEPQGRRRHVDVLGRGDAAQHLADLLDARPGEVEAVATI